MNICLAVLLAVVGLDFYDIVPYAPGREKETAQDIRAVHERAGLDTFLYCVSLDPRGYPAFKAVEDAMASYRALKKELAGEPVKLGFLLQSIMGHWPRVDREIEPWQRSVDIDGKVKRFCVLDPRYRDYIRKTATALAKESPCFILGDDDIRAFSPHRECFCPLHTAEFNKRAGTNLTSEQFRKAVKEGKLDARQMAIADALRAEIPGSVVALLREGMDAVDPHLPGGLCMPGAEELWVLPRVKAMAGAGNPTTLRLANGLYCEMGRSDMIHYVQRTQACIECCRGKVDRILDESDTFPHTLYSRSGRTFASKLALGIFNGLRGAKLWYVGMHKGAERVPEAHDKALGENKLLYRALATALDGSRPLGLRLPARLKGNSFEQTSWDWVNWILGLYGVPFYVDFSTAPGAPVLLSGSMVSLPDAALKEALSGSVLIDASAATNLAGRGFVPLLGCHPVVDERAFNIEVLCSDRSRPPFSKTKGTPALVDVDPAAKVLSELHYSAVGASDPNTRKIAAGAVCYKNKAGGTALTTSFDASYIFTAQSPRRKTWLVEMLRALDPAFPVVCANLEPNMTLARQGKDGKTYVITLNLSYDDITELRYACARGMANPEVLGRDGQWHRVEARATEGQARFAQHLGCFEFVVVRW